MYYVNVTHKNVIIIIIIFWFYSKKGINESHFFWGGGVDIKFNNIHQLSVHFYGHLQPGTINNVFTSIHCDLQS